MIKIRSGLKYIVCALILLIVGGMVQTAGAVGYLTISIDDGFQNIYTNAYPILKDRDIPATFYVPSTTVGSGVATAYANYTELLDLQNNGWEIGTHGNTGVWFSNISNNSNSLYNEIVVSKNNFTSRGIVIQSLAYPAGRYDNVSSNYVHNYYVVARTTDSTGGRAVNASEMDSIIRINYDGQGVGYSTQSAIQGWINNSINNSAWLTIYFHDVNASGFINTSYEGGQNLTSLADFIKSQVDAGNLVTCTYIECYYKMKNISSEVQSKHHFVINQSNFSYNMMQDVMSSPILVINGITINNTALNPSFETLTLGVPDSWTKSVGVRNLTFNSTNPKYGVYSGNITVNISAAGKNIYQDRNLASLGYSVGDRYYLSAWFKNSDNVTEGILVMSYYNGGAYISQVDSGVISLTNGEWNQATITGVIPATTTKLQIALQVQTATGVPNANATMLVDGVSLSKVYNRYQYSDFGNQNSTNISIFDGTNYFNITDLGANQSTSFSLIRMNSSMNVTVDGSKIINISINGTRGLSVKYGFVNQSTIEESYANYTSIEFWNNWYANLIENINYSVRNGVSASIGTMTLTPSGAGVNTNISVWNKTGDYRKVFNLSASASATAGDFAPNTNYWIYKNGVKWTTFKSNSTGYISFSDTITAETQYSTLSATVQDAYTTSTCQSTLQWGVVGSALIIILILLSAGGMALGFMTGTLKFDTFPIQEFVFSIVAVVVIGLIGVAIINPIIILVGCP